MNLRKPVKVFVGAMTALLALFPLVILPAGSVLLLFSLGFPFADPQSAPSLEEFGGVLIPAMLIFYPVAMCFSLLQVGLQVFYIIHEIKNKALTDTFRILFVLGTFFMPIVAMPIYFIVHVWKDAPQAPNAPQT